MQTSGSICVVVEVAMIRKALNMLRQQGPVAFGCLVAEKLRNVRSQDVRYRRWIHQYERPLQKLRDSWITEVELDSGLYGRLQEVQTEWVVFRSPDVQLAPDFTARAATYVQCHPNVVLIYTDEDQLVDGKRTKPIFKPDWAPDTYFCQDYFGPCLLVKTSLARPVASQMYGKYQNGWLYDFGLRAVEALEACQIGHIDQMMFHRTAPAKKVSPQYLIQMKEQAIARRKKSGAILGKARTELRMEGQAAAVVYEPGEAEDGEPYLISIVVPSKDNPELLATCMRSVEKYTTYPAVEWIIVDNGSTPDHQRAYRALFDTLRFPCQYIVRESEFNFSSMCNLGATHAKGQFLLFLNDDIELSGQSADWLSRLAGHALQPHVGAVGAKLLYPDSTLIQHCGVVNYTTGAAHLLWQFDDREELPYWRNETEHNYSIVTAACLCVKTDRFWAVGGFEQRLAVTFNDVALCLALLRGGYYQVVRSDVVLYHHESITRGVDTEDEQKTIRGLRERELLYDLFPEAVGVDPFYSRHLTQKRLDHTIDDPGRLCSAQIRRVQGGGKISSEHVHWRVERIRAEGNEVTVEGWAFAEKRFRGGCKGIILESEGTVFFVPIRRVYTPTLPLLWHTGQNLYRCGFCCRFVLPEQGQDMMWRIGLCFADGYCLTGCGLAVRDGRVLPVYERL